MVDTSRLDSAGRESRSSARTDALADGFRATTNVTDGIVNDYGAMRRSIESIVERSDVDSALRSVDPM